MKAHFFSYLLIILVSCSYAQPTDTLYLNTEQAKELILQRNPAKINALLNTNAIKLKRQANFDIGTTEVSYDYGQINGPMNDYSFSVSQNFGNIAQKIAQSKVLEEEIKFMQQKEKLTERELKFQICETFNSYIYWHKTAQTCRKFLELYKNALEVTDQKAKESNIAISEQIIIEKKYDQLNWEYNSAILNMNNSLRDFNTLLYSDSVWYIPSTDTLKCKLHIKLFDTSMLMNNPQILMEKINLEIKQKEIAVAKAAISPEISVGYFNQQIEGTPGFRGFNITIAFPVWFLPASKEIKMAKLEHTIQENQLNYTKRTFFNEYTQLVDKYLHTKAKLDYYEKKGLKMANELLQFATEQYKEGKIDYIEYLENLLEAYSIIQEYNSTLYTYNTLIRNINYLAYNE